MVSILLPTGWGWWVGWALTNRLDPLWLLFLLSLPLISALNEFILITGILPVIHFFNN